MCSCVHSGDLALLRNLMRAGIDVDAVRRPPGAELERWASSRCTRGPVYKLSGGLYRTLHRLWPACVLSGIFEGAAEVTLALLV